MTAGVVDLRCATEADTEATGRAIGADLHGGELLLLTGELGAGKTVLVRGIAAGLGIDPEAVRSPTFVLHHVYRPGRLTLHHLDLYRLGPGADIRLFGIDELLTDGAAVVIEWGEHARQDALATRSIEIIVEADAARLLRIGPRP